MQSLRAGFGWIMAAVSLLFVACAPGATDGLSGDRRAQCSPVNDPGCRPLYCPTGSQHECAAQDLCDNFFSYECFDPKVDTPWSRPQEPQEPSMVDEFTAPFSAVAEMSLFRTADPTASSVPLPKYRIADPEDVIASDYIHLVAEQFVQPALALEDGIWNELRDRIQTDPEYALRIAKQHALVYENMKRNSQWLRLFSRVLFGKEWGSLEYCQPWIDRLKNPPDVSEYNSQLDQSMIVNEVSSCLDMYGQVLAYLFDIEKKSGLFSRSRVYNVLASLEQTLAKLAAGHLSPEYAQLLEDDHAAIADVHDTIRAFIESTTSMLLRAQTSYAWLEVKPPGVYREAPTQIGKLAQRAAEEAYRSSVDPQQVGSWQEQYQRAVSWYAERRIDELETLNQLLGQVNSDYVDIDVSDHKWYFWGLMEASGLLALYPEYALLHSEWKARFQADLQRASSAEQTQVACAGFVLSFVAPTAVLKAGKGAEIAVWAGRATKLALAGAVLAVMQSASAERPGAEESAWVAMLRHTLPTLLSIDFWKDFGGLLAPQIAEAFSPACFSLWEQRHEVDYLDTHAPGLLHLNSLTSIMLHAGMTGTDSLVDPSRKATTDPTWAFLLLPTEHPEYAVGTKYVTSSAGYDLFAKNVGSARAMYGLQSTGRVKVTFADHLDLLNESLHKWADQAIPFWDRLETALYGPEDWIPRFSTQSTDTLAAQLAGILASDRPSRFDETWMEMVRHMRSSPAWSMQQTEQLLAGMTAVLGTRARATLQLLARAMRATQQADAYLASDLLKTIPILPYQGADWQHAAAVAYDLQQLQGRLAQIAEALDRQVAVLSTVALRSR